MYQLGRSCIAAVLVSVIIFATFHSVVTYPFLNFDDSKYVYENPHLVSGLSAAGLKWAFAPSLFHLWHPVTCLSYLLDYELFGLDPHGYHFVNLLIHTVNVVLLLLVLEASTKEFWPSLLAAALFGLHPLRVEPVAWISSRKDVLSTMFLMLAIWAYLKYAKDRCWRAYLLVLLSLVAGLMAKSMLVTVPFLFLLLDYWPLRRLRFSSAVSSPVNSAASSDAPGAASALCSNSANASHEKPLSSTGTAEANVSPISNRDPAHRDSSAPDHLPGAKAHHDPRNGTIPWRRLIGEKIPMLLLSFVIGVITYSISQRQPPMGITAPGDWNRWFMVSMTYLGYAEKLLWPSHLAPFYPRDVASLSSSWLVMSLVFMIGASVLTIAFARRRPYLIVGWLWFLLSLSPVVGLVRFSGHLMADRYAYVPSIGYCIIVAWLLGELASRGNWSRHCAVLCSATVLVAYAVTSWRQTQHWRDSVALFEHTLQVTANNFLAHTNLASALLAQGKIDDAEAHYSQALKIRADSALAHEGLGIVYRGRGDFAKAIHHYNEALRSKPNDIHLLITIANLLEEAGNTEEAASQFELAVAQRPYSADASYQYGRLLARHGQTAKAVEQLERAVRIRRDFAEAHCELGNSLLNLGRLDAAERSLNDALRFKPRMAEAHGILGNVRAMSGRFEDAIAHYRAAIDARPEWAEIHNNLGVALTQVGRLDEAIRHHARAVQIDSAVTDGFYNLGCALHAAGRNRDAADTFSRGLEQSSNSTPLELSLAWIRATDEDPALRNGEEAVRLATRACDATGYRQTMALDVLAAAYAEAGQFDEAVKYIDQAMALANTAGQTTTMIQLSEKRQLYELGKPYRSKRSGQ